MAFRHSTDSPLSTSIGHGPVPEKRIPTAAPISIPNKPRQVTVGFVPGASSIPKTPLGSDSQLSGSIGKPFPMASGVPQSPTAGISLGRSGAITGSVTLSSSLTKTSSADMAAALAQHASSALTTSTTSSTEGLTKEERRLAKEREFALKGAPEKKAKKTKEEQEAERAAKTNKDGKSSRSSSNDVPVVPAIANLKEPLRSKSDSTVPTSSSLRTCSSTGPTKNQTADPKFQADDEKLRLKKIKALAKQQVPTRPKAKKVVKFFEHIGQFERGVSLTETILFNKGTLHPLIVRLGLKYSEGVLSGGTARTLALITALKAVIQDYVMPEGKELARELDLGPTIGFLKECRQFSEGMNNVIKRLKVLISAIQPGEPEASTREKLRRSLDEFADNILQAQRDIAEFASNKIKDVEDINDGDVILVYGSSSMMLQVFRYALGLDFTYPDGFTSLSNTSSTYREATYPPKVYRKPKNFRVVIIDSGPRYKGKDFLTQCVSIGLRCTYALIPSISYIMPEVTKVFLPTYCVLSNGYVMGKVGFSLIAMIAKAQNVPVLSLCESYKFVERAQTDSFVFNELGDPDDLAHTQGKPNVLQGWKNIDLLKLLNLGYDVTPSHMIDAIITEYGLVPCSSVHVINSLVERNTV